MNGKLVIIRCCGGQAAIGRVWSIKASTVLIYGKELYELAVKSQTQLDPVGFRRKDVFNYCNDVAEIVKTNHSYIPDWSNLQSIGTGLECE